MKKAVLLGLVALFAASLSGQDFTLGSKVTDFGLTDVDGKSVSFSSLRGDITVVMFVATKCPISNDYNQRMNALYDDYSERGVKFVAINANHSEPAPEVEEHSKKNGFQFAVYKDANNVVADRFGAQVTPETFVVSNDGTIRYHGAIDDSRNVAGVKVQSLRNALDETLAGESVTTARTKAFGCTIKRVKKST